MEIPSEQATEAAKAATVQYFSATNDACVQEVLAACGNPSPEEIADSVDVFAACSQVVAGTNYKVAFTVVIPCSNADAEKLDGKTQLTPEFEADVFEPLPSDNGGEGQSTTVNNIKVTGGVCKGVKASPSPSPSPSPAPLVGGNGLCADPGSLGPNAAVGGYAPVEIPSEQATEAAQAAATKAWKSEGKCYEEVIAVCGATEKAFVDSVDVTAACSQVVAGTNYKLAFTTTIPCDKENEAKLKNKKQLTQTWEADVFVPLPSSDDKIEVKDSKETSGTCEGLKATPSPVAPSPGSAPSPGPTPEPSSASGVALSAALFAGATAVLLA